MKWETVELVRTYKDLIAWKGHVEFVKKIYNIANGYPKEID